MVRSCLKHQSTTYHGLNKRHISLIGLIFLHRAERFG